jgi:hypothetical protein
MRDAERFMDEVLAGLTGANVAHDAMAKSRRSRSYAARDLTARDLTARERALMEAQA